MMNAQLNFKDTLQNNNDDLHQQFTDGMDIVEILKSRSRLLDGMLQEMWQKHQLGDLGKLSLVAVGGYGREEMHPASDVDLLVLLAEEPDADTEEKLSDFVTELWDLGLEIGHSVRTIDECIEEATADLTVITNLIESRFLCGDSKLYEGLKNKISTDKMWSSKDFFLAKIEEQNQRYARFGDTSYRVEPNLKEGPGGLRDIQTIGWIVLREYGIGSLKTLSELKANDLLNDKEYQSLIKARDFLWKVRFVLHRLTGRKEDRLLFDHQRHLAHSFGYVVDEKNQSIEAFMQRYYKTITELERLNEILLGLLRERILKSVKPNSIVINESFNNEGGYLDLIDNDCFVKHPPTFLYIFHLLQIDPFLKGLTPRTIRELRRNLHLMDDSFRQNEANKALFMKIVSQPQRVNFVLRRMNRYGVLAAYIPAFANIVGRMQYDLFHAFTVDEHTLKVVRNIRHLSTPQGAIEHPFSSALFNKMEKPMILVLAGIFHDIAKGREGNHSDLGSVDALIFCREHHLSEYDSQTVSWLVEHHLLLSSVAQRKDINDPEVVKELVEIVKTQERLDYLYVLTISDIKGTNPSLLTSWKHSLLKELYGYTSRYISNLASNESHEDLSDFGLEQMVKKKQAVLDLMAKEGLDSSHCEDYWARFDNDYFQQYSKERLFWHIKEISGKQYEDNIICIADSHKKDSTVLLIYGKDRSNLFVRITSAIEQQRLDIVGASITSTRDDYDLHTFYLLDRDGNMLEDADDKKLLLESVKESLRQAKLSYNFSHHRMPRQLKHFDTKTKVSFSLDENLQQTVITIKTADSAGLLTRIGEVFSQYGLNIHTARITTLGETAEDIFQVTSSSGKMIDDEMKFSQIEEALKQKLQG